MSFKTKKRHRTLVWYLTPVFGLTCLLGTVQAADNLTYAGVNLSGAEFNPKKKPGVLNKDYRYPAAADYSYFARKGMNIVRLPFLWERIQPSVNGPLDQDQLAMIRKAVENAQNNHQSIILDAHNYGSYNGMLLGSERLQASALVDLWKKLAREFKDNESVIFGIMNEPNGIRADGWMNTAQQTVDAIRRVGARNLVLIPGTAYTGAHSWMMGQSGGPSNAEALQNFRDPANHMAIEVHQYLDGDFSGTTGQCPNPSVGTQSLSGLTNWLRQTHKVGFLAEFAGGDNPACKQGVEGMLGFMEQNKDVWLGWTWWAAGAWWKSDYPFNLQMNTDGSDKPQMAWIAPHAREVTRAQGRRYSAVSATPVLHQYHLQESDGGHWRGQSNVQSDNAPQSSHRHVWSQLRQQQNNR